MWYNIYDRKLLLKIIIVTIELQLDGAYEESLVVQPGSSILKVDLTISNENKLPLNNSQIAIVFFENGQNLRLYEHDSVESKDSINPIQWQTQNNSADNGFTITSSVFSVEPEKTQSTYSYIALEKLGQISGSMSFTFSITGVPQPIKITHNFLVYLIYQLSRGYIDINNQQTEPVDLSGDLESNTFNIKLGVLRSLFGIPHVLGITKDISLCFKADKCATQGLYFRPINFIGDTVAECTWVSLDKSLDDMRLYSHASTLVKEMQNVVL
ncbi:hypothetical protein AX774_g7440 [Zancudomyces culisetae]|uniref:Uncharacterized protein n=1 Tax=Zancudomyces culisetae TaxID=1213189 RepID=A0A1R1PDU6_ZANCU|nr:hypothetical protein AX774_g7440 [Zancudomyces culisetae]|eukprot:OMH79154.1 hypothetical protein AX774_g7440 [Zancudomyces culisetae]